MTEPGIELLSSSRVDAALELLAGALDTDPGLRTVFPADERGGRARRTALLELWLRCCLPHDAVFCTSGEMAGVAACLPPGRFPVSKSDALRTLGTRLAKLSLKMGVRGLRRAEAFKSALEAAHRELVGTGHWYLMLLAFDSGRRDVGSALIGALAARADSAQLPCYLETFERARVEYYAEHGFDVLEQRVLPGTDVTFWAMRRLPRPA